MNPVSGERAPQASMSRSETSREVSVRTSRESTSSGRSPVVSTSSPPCGRISCRSVAVLMSENPHPGRGSALRPQKVGEKSAPMCTATCPFRPQGLSNLRAGASGLHLRVQEAHFLEPLEHDARALLRLVLLGLQHDLRAGRYLVRIRDSRELLDLTPEGLLVKALHVAPGALLDRRVDEDLHERPELLDHVSGLLARLLIRGNRRDENRGTLAGQARSHPADALDVRVAVLLREPEALRKARPDDVSVEVLDEPSAFFELRAHDLRDRRLPRA